MKPQTQISIKWSNELAYAIGLVATDGNLSKDKRHMTFVSKDLQLIKTFKTCLGLKNKVSLKNSGFVSEKRYYFIQFSNVVFYQFLLTIGLKPAKSNNIGSIQIPKKFFFDYLRGELDGDGYFFSYYDKRWKHSFMFYTNFTSSSRKHLYWLRNKIQKYLKIKGSLNYSGKNTWILRYAKRASLLLINKMYCKEKIPCLYRKRKKIFKALKLNIDVGRGDETW